MCWMSYTVELAFYTCFEQPPAIYSHFSLSGFTFYVYFMDNMCNAVPSNFLRNFMATVYILFVDWYLSGSLKWVLMA